MPFSLISAIADNNCIGKDNKLPWNIPEDLEHFKQLTIGKTCIMGEATFESILGYLGKPLPDRKTVVLTLNKEYKVPIGVRMFHDIDEAWEALRDEDCFVCGGATIYKLTLDRVDTLYITHVHMEVDGDAFFPDIDKDKWTEVQRVDHEKFSFVTYKRK